MSDPLATEADVRAVGSFNIDDLTPYITSAHAVVEQFLLNRNISADLLTQIEIYLSAHYATLRDPRIKQVAIHSGNVTYLTAPLGPGLQSTPYGQQVIALDYTNTLYSLGKNKATVRMI